MPIRIRDIKQMFFPQKASRRKALRAAMMEEFRVAEEAREANTRLNQLSQEEVSHSREAEAVCLTKPILVRINDNQLSQEEVTGSMET